MSAAGFVLLLGLGATLSCTGPEDHRVLCTDPAKVVALRNTHYPDETCQSAAVLAEKRLTTAFYLKACQQLAPSAGLPSRIEAAKVVSCEPASQAEGYDRGVVAQIEICCL